MENQNFYSNLMIVIIILITTAGIIYLLLFAFLGKSMTKKMTNLDISPEQITTYVENTTSSPVRFESYMQAGIIKPGQKSKIMLHKKSFILLGQRKIFYDPLIRNNNLFLITSKGIVRGANVIQNLLIENQFSFTISFEICDAIHSCKEQYILPNRSIKIPYVIKDTSIQFFNPKNELIKKIKVTSNKTIFLRNENGIEMFDDDNDNNYDDFLYQYKNVENI
jgi:hypothetical protein